MTFNNIHKSYIANLLKNLTFFGAITVPYFIDWLKIDFTRMFILQAWFLFWSFVMEIPTGIIADKYGRKYSVGFGSLLFGIEMLFFGVTQNYYLLFVAEFIGAIGVSMISGAENALIVDSAIEMKKEEKTKYFLARYEAFGTAGMLIAFPLGSYIGSINYPNNLYFTFIMTAIAGLSGFIFFLTVKEPLRTKSEDNYIKMAINGFKTLFLNKKLLSFTLNSVTISAITFYIFWFYQPILKNLNIDLTYFGFVAAGSNLFALILLNNIKYIEKYAGISKLIFYSALFPGVFFVLLCIINNKIFGIIAIFIIIGLKLMRFPVLMDYINQHIESSNRATVLSTVSILEKSIIFILYPIIGIIADISLQYALLLLGIICIVFAIVTRVEEKHLNNAN